MQYDVTHNEDEDMMLFFTDAKYRASYLSHRLADIQKQTSENGYAVSGSALITHASNTAPETQEK